VIDLFSGAGGFSEGFVQSGHQIILASDINRNMCYTYKQNHPKTSVMNSNLLAQEEFEAVIEKAESLLRGRTLNLLAGGPPCQGFSTAGNWNSADSRNDLVYIMLKVAQQLQPESIVIENVQGLKWMKKGLILESILSDLSELGYRCSVFTLHAEEYGVPQRRRRIFIVANDSGNEFQKPASLFSGITHSRNRTNIKFTSENLAHPLTVAESIADLPELSQGKGQHIMEYNPDWIQSSYQLFMRGAISFDSFLRDRAE
jgi:DNA (cytosine-5)-methyltransferase 1